MPNISQELSTALDSMQNTITKAEEVLNGLPMATETEYVIFSEAEGETRILVFQSEKLQLKYSDRQDKYGGRVYTQQLSQLPIARRIECCQHFPAFLEAVHNRSEGLPREVLQTVDLMHEALATVETD